MGKQLIKRSMKYVIFFMLNFTLLYSCNNMNTTVKDFDVTSKDTVFETKYTYGEDTIKCIAPYVKDKLNGEVTGFYGNVKIFNVTFKDDVPNGYYKKIFKNGMLQNEGEYYYGKLLYSRTYDSVGNEMIGLMPYCDIQYENKIVLIKFQLSSYVVDNHEIHLFYSIFKKKDNHFINIDTTRHFKMLRGQYSYVDSFSLDNEYDTIGIKAILEDYTLDHESTMKYSFYIEKEGVIFNDNSNSNIPVDSLDELGVKVYIPPAGARMNN